MSLFPDIPAFSSASMLRRDQWLIRLRWLAILGLLSGTLLLKMIDLGPPNNIKWMAITGCFMLALNFRYVLYASRKRQFGMSSLVILMNVQMVIDLIVLTFLVYLTGSEESPLMFFYVFHIILASIIFPGGFSYYYSILVIFLFSLLLAFEHSGIIPHTCFFHEINLAGDVRLAIGVWFIFVITMVVSAYLAQNVTERHRRVRQKLEIANLKLQEVNETKTTFFRFASHEMKSPVATIQSTLLVIQDLLGEKVDKRAKDMLNRAIGRTSEIIEMLKDLADLTYGNLQEQKEFTRVDLNTILVELVEDLLPNAERKKQTLSIKVPRKRCRLNGDSSALKKIFSNLISNAIRYTASGGEIKVSLKFLKTHYEIVVSDNGLGIPESEQVNIFKEFYRTAAAKKNISEGTGLGLAIVLRMVELHGGSILVNSVEGQGSQFTVELPIREIV